MKVNNFVQLVLVLFSVSLLACGGGTRGTGTGSDQTTAISQPMLSGQIATESGAPIKGIKITDLNTNESEISDDSGAFSLPLPSGRGSSRLRFEVQSFSAEVDLILIPGSSLSASVVINGPFRLLQLRIEETGQSLTTEFKNFK